jgi:hypothetical protein
MQVRLDGLHTEANKKPLVNGEPKSLYTPCEISLKLAVARPLFQGTLVPYTNRAKVLDKPSKLFQAVPISVAPQLDGCSQVARLGIGKLTQEGDQLVVSPELLPVMPLKMVVGSLDNIAVKLVPVSLRLEDNGCASLLLEHKDLITFS